MTKLTRSIDKLKFNLLKMLPAAVIHETLTHNQSSLLHSNNGALHHNPVIANLTIMNKSTHRRNALFCQIGSRHTTLLISGFTNTVHFLIHLRTMKVSILTSTWNGITHTSRMPRTNTGDLTQTTMRLTRQPGNTPTCRHTFITTTLGHSNHINILILRKHTIHSNLLLKQSLGKLNFSSRIRSTIHLNLHDMGLLHPRVTQLLRLRMSNDTNHTAKLPNTTQLRLNILRTILILRRILHIRLLLTRIPIPVTTPLKLITQMLGKHSRQRTQSTWSLHISNNTHNDHRRSLNHTDGIHDLTFVH
mmetsp:Transcript_3561/g.4848  ORF Transcript_3561/g.4848 Transcript_3561/m.4848 type:complete len:304 (-) Transcript_3561:223-1134(-)